MRKLLLLVSLLAAVVAFSGCEDPDDPTQGANKPLYD